MTSLKIQIAASLLILGLLVCAYGCRKTETPATISTTDDPAQYETPFAGVPDASEVIMYEINERAFSNTGDFAGILPRLDSIKALGINVIWLMPIHPIGAIRTVNSPYCIKNYKEVNPEFGNLEDLRLLVRESHSRGMAVVLDWAANHTSWDNPWIANRSWYTQDVNGNIIHPAGTNWQDVADLDFNNADMRLEMIKAMKYWILTANVDGFRCDAADFVPFSFWKQANDAIKAIPNRETIMLAEGARADHFTAGFQLNFGWDFFGKNKNIFKNAHSASDLFTTHQTEYRNIPAGSHKLRFTSNHDECAWDDTPIGLFGSKDASMSAFVVSAFMGGVPLIYNGQEVGYPVKLPFFSRSPIDWRTNPRMMIEYKRLMSLFISHPALRSGTLTPYPNVDVVVFQKQTSNDEVFVLANTRNRSVNYSIPSGLRGTTWQNTLNGASVTLGSTLSLNANEYIILAK